MHTKQTHTYTCTHTHTHTQQTSARKPNKHTHTTWFPESVFAELGLQTRRSDLEMKAVACPGLPAPLLTSQWGLTVSRGRGGGGLDATDMVIED